MRFHDKKIRIFVATSFLVALLFTGCGGGGTTGSPSGSATPSPKILSWSPPTSYTDGTPLNPLIDLDHIEIYVNTTGSFSIFDSPTALVAAVDPVTNQLTTSFNLSNLASFQSKGVLYYVSLRDVDRAGTKSEFSPFASYTF